MLLNYSSPSTASTSSRSTLLLSPKHSDHLMPRFIRITLPTATAAEYPEAIPNEDKTAQTTAQKSARTLNNGSEVDSRTDYYSQSVDNVTAGYIAT